MKTALIGYTGFVGGNILKQKKFTNLYNSKNIEQIKNKKYDLIVCAGIKAVKWWANQHPDEDWKGIQNLMNNLRHVKTERFVLISTIDVYPQPVNVDENTEIDPRKSQPYGKNRFFLEDFIRKNFNNHYIIRLPALFGEGLKKNFIYDLIYNNRLDLTNEDSSFQFYNLENIWKDISEVIKQDVSLVNFATEPLSAKKVAKFCLDLDFKNKKANQVSYNVKTIYAKILKNKKDYLYFKNEILPALKTFILKKKNENSHF